MSFEVSSWIEERSSRHCANDSDLIRYHLKGDTHAFSVLYKRYGDYVVRIISRERLDDDAISDCAQECWIRAAKGLSKYESKARFDVWLYRIACNVVAEYGRRLQRDQRLVSAFSGVLSTPSAPDTSRSNLETELLKPLPNGMRVVLSLWIAGYKHFDIAGILGIAEGTSKSQLAKAGRKVSQHLRDSGPG